MDMNSGAAEAEVYDVAFYKSRVAQLRRDGRDEEAEPLLLTARGDFPREAWFAMELADIASKRRDWAAAMDRWGHVRSLRDVNRELAFVREIRAARELGRLDEAEALAGKAIGEYPRNIDLAVARGLIAEAREDYPAIRERWAYMRQIHGDKWEAFFWSVRGLRQIGDLDEAEALCLAGLERFGASADAREKSKMEYARIAEARKDWPEALRRWREVEREFLNHPGVRSYVLRMEEAILEPVRKLRDSGDFDAADLLCRARLERCEGKDDPLLERLLDYYAHIAETRGDWPEALRRWQDVQFQFPENRSAPFAVYRMRSELMAQSVESWRSGEGQSAPMNFKSDGVACRDEDAKLFMRFEALGDNCEFGGVQRHFGAEPISLMRWGGISPRDLAQSLRARFAGWGEPGTIEISPAGDNDYMIRERERRFHMHAFLSSTDTDPERLLKQTCRRIAYLRNKLIEDLEAAEKIFLYKPRSGRLSASEIADIHAAIRSYGKPLLMCVRLEDADHPNGLVEWGGDGLLLAYIDSVWDMKRPETIKYESWRAICARAWEMVQEGQPG